MPNISNYSVTPVTVSVNNCYSVTVSVINAKKLKKSLNVEKLAAGVNYVYDCVNYQYHIDS